MLFVWIFKIQILFGFYPSHFNPIQKKLNLTKKKTNKKNEKRKIKFNPTQTHHNCLSCISSN